MNQPQDRLPIDMRDEVSGLQSCLLGGAPLLHAPDDMVYSVDVTVAHVDADGPQAEAVLLAGAVDDNGGPQAATHRGRVSAGR